MVKCPSCGEDNPPKFRWCGYCGTTLAADVAAALPVREVRKTVTLVFTDLKDSTALGERLDSEALHEVKERYFAAMAQQIERHGGKIEKYIGDAIMAVFGLPQAHEDDALRAVRAAVGMRDKLNEMNAALEGRFGVTLAARTGVNTGEVVALDDPAADQKFATGDVVNVTARLEAAAPANEIYIGEMTYRLVRDAVEAEAVGPLTLKGKSQPVPTYRIVSATGLYGTERRNDTPVIGRDTEVATLHSAWRAAVATRRAHLVTVLADAGVGKSRLVRELMDRVRADARLLSGRCLAYGEGITFWPLREMVVAAAGIDRDDTPEVAHGKLLRCVGNADVAERLASAAGMSSRQFPLHEVNWSARRFMQCLANDRPLLVMIDDIHWAEPAFLDLLENLVDTIEDAPVLLVATSRHDLLEARAEWGRRERSTRLVLEPLSDDAAAQVVRNLFGASDLPEGLVGRIVAAAEGNPLYVEQMLSMIVDSAAASDDGTSTQAQVDAGTVVPPTIRALLEARVDKLERTERAAAEPASVIGMEFTYSAVESLAPQQLRHRLDEQLRALARKRFIYAASDDPNPRFRFDHQLVRDTVYNGLLKRARATMHTEFVEWADKVNPESYRGPEFEAILGYHLEQAYKYLRELGPVDDAGVAIGRDAARRLSGAGRRAFGRGDMHAAANLFRRATQLVDKQDPLRLQLLTDLGEVLMELGDFTESRAVLDEAQVDAEQAKKQRIAASARLFRMRVRFFSAEPGDWGDATLRTAEEAIPLFEAQGAHPELARAWRLIGLVHGVAARYGRSTDAVSRSMMHARLAQDDRLIARNAVGLASSALLGPTPVLQAIELCEQMIANGLGDRQAESKILCTLAQLHAMSGDFEKARSSYRRGRAMLRELGQGLNAAANGIDVLQVELLAGDLAGAEREVMTDLAFLESAGETFYLSTMAAVLSRVVRDQGRDEDALALSRKAEEATASDDVESLVLWQSTRAPILARAGRIAEAESLARSAVELSLKSDAPQMQADSLSELAAVLMQANQPEEARRVIERAISIYQAKGDVVSAARSLAWAGQLG